MIKHLKLASVIFFFLGAVVGLFVVGYIRQNHLQLKSNAAEPIVMPTTIPPFVPTTGTASQISPDGTKNVTVTTTQKRDKTQTVEVSNDDGDSTIFTMTLQDGEAMIVPFNTWSPDNRYFFLQKKTKTSQEVYVFKENGEAFADGSAYLNLTEAYTQNSDGNTYEATGWAGYNVIVINTTLSDGTQGKSYWYEVPSGTIIPLSTKF